jgi:D-alanyl-D-alanine carboxypeptidase
VIQRTTTPVRRGPMMLAVAVLLAASSAASLRADADSTSTQLPRDQARAQRAHQAVKIDPFKADEAEVADALRFLQVNVGGQAAGLSEAQRAAATAQAYAVHAKVELQATQQALLKLRREMTRKAVEAYTQPANDPLTSVLDASDASEAVKREALINLSSEAEADLADRFRALTARMENTERVARAANRLAESSQHSLDTRSNAAKRARAEQAAFAAKVQERIINNLSLSIELATTDRKLSARLAREEGSLQAQLLAVTNADEVRALKEVEAAGPAPIEVSTRVSSGAIELCTVDNITVNCQIAGTFGAMMGAAKAAGLRLTGAGYRSTASQVSLRRSHCGSSYYAIYQMSPSSCSPPTAKPGASMHELGVAIDFENCQSRSGAVFAWLSNNAARFGFYNLRSEPWHWSINAQ